MATNPSITHNSSDPRNSRGINFEFYLPGSQRLHSSYSLPPEAALAFAHHANRTNEKTNLLQSKHIEPIPAFKPIDIPEANGVLDILATHSAKSSATAYPISGGAGSTEDVIADISYFGRTLCDLGTDPVYQAIGVTTGENVFMGFYAAYKAWDRFQKASRVGDFGGKVDGGLDTLRGVTQGIGGGFYLGYRATMIASELGNVNTSMTATTALGKTTFGLGLIGNFFFGLFYMFIGVWGGYHLYQSGKFLHGMNKTQSVVPLLMAQAHADTHEKLRQLQDATELRKAHFKQGLSKKCLNEFATQFLAQQKQMKKAGKLQGKELSRSEMKKVVKELFDAIDKNPEAKTQYRKDYYAKMGLKPQEVEFLNLSSLEICGLKLEEQHRQIRKEARFERAAGAEALAKVKDAYKKGLAERLASPNQDVRAAATREAAELEKTVRSGLIKNLVIFSTFVLIGILGLTITVATIGLFALPAALAVVMKILTVALVVVMAGIDIYFWKTGLDSSAKPGKYDKLFIIAIASVLVIAMAVAIGLTWGFALPLVPLILTLIMGGLGLGVCAYGYVKTDQREKNWKENHPDLKRVEDALQDQDVELDKRATALFKKLSKAERQAVRSKYFEQGAPQQEFKTKEYLELNAAANFGGRYVDRAIFELTPDKASTMYPILHRAAKKTAKVYWEKWHHAQDPNNVKKALKMHEFMALLKKKDKQVLQNKLGKIKEEAELYQAFKANIYYLCRRQESAKDLKSAINAVRTAKREEDPQLNSQQMKRVQEIYGHSARSAA